jgi:hypothetical protein
VVGRAVAYDQIRGRSDMLRRMHEADFVDFELQHSRLLTRSTGLDLSMVPFHRDIRAEEERPNFHITLTTEDSGPLNGAEERPTTQHRHDREDAGITNMKRRPPTHPNDHRSKSLTDDGLFDCLGVPTG